MREGRERERRWLALYALTVVLEAPVMMARYVTGLVVATVVLKRAAAAAAPARRGSRRSCADSRARSCWSALGAREPQGRSLRGGGSGCGGREPSEREREVYRGALEQLRERTQTRAAGTRRAWFRRRRAETVMRRSTGTR